jgi:hypothetical protein
MPSIDAQYKRIDWDECQFLRANGWWPTPYPEYFGDEDGEVNKAALVCDYWCAQRSFWDAFDRWGEDA